MRSTAIMAAALAALGFGWSAAQAGEPTPPEGVTVLSEDELAATFVENTLHGVDSGKKYWEIYEPDGAIRGLWDRDHYRGKWSIEDGMFCLDYKGTGYDGCWFVRIYDGNNVAWYKPDGTPDGEGDVILEGNPKNL